MQEGEIHAASLRGGGFFMISCFIFQIFEKLIGKYFRLLFKSSVLKNTIFIMILVLAAKTISAQEKKGVDSESKVLKSVIIDEDTVFIADIPEVRIYPSRSFSNRWQYWRYRRLVRNVKAAYPYAKMAGKLLKDLDKELASMPTEIQRKHHVKKVEKEIREEFEDEVKHLTISQGRILIKLVDRETGNTTYEVLQDLKGNFSAVFWQAIARIFGSTLRSEYEPEGEDQQIENIVLMIESGQL